MELRFDWNSAKYRSNQDKHGVSFSEAATVFGDPLSVLIPDPLHSENEERWTLLGSLSGSVCLSWSILKEKALFASLLLV